MCDPLDLRILEDAGVEFGGFLGPVIEPQAWTDSLHMLPSRRRSDLVQDTNTLGATSHSRLAQRPRCKWSTVSLHSPAFLKSMRKFVVPDSSMEISSDRYGSCPTNSTRVRLPMSPMSAFLLPPATK